MSVYETADFDDHEQVVFFNDPDAGLKAILAIHNTNLGPALGGCRMWPYATEAEAIRDVLRLSRGMTYKAAMVGADLGGGKSVIIGDSRKAKTRELLHAMGRAINSLNERYIVGEDIGTNPDDMREIATQTRCVTCLRVADGGYGDPAPMTALGVFSAMRAGIEHALGTADFKGLRVAVQGVGNVGANLCRLLRDEGAELIVTDVHAESLKAVAAEVGAKTVAPEAIYDVEAEVFAPCAMGAVLNDATIPRLKAKVVAGAANNQLDRDRHGTLLAEAGITYLPDYVANGGGLVSCAAEWYRHDIGQVAENVRKIHGTCVEILERAGAAGIATSAAADAIAEDRFGKANNKES
jgi:leucine dehydrogenase